MFQVKYWYLSIVGLNEEKAFVCELGPNLSFKSHPLKFYPKTFSSPYICTLFYSRPALNYRKPTTLVMLVKNFSYKFSVTICFRAFKIEPELVPPALIFLSAVIKSLSLYPWSFLLPALLSGGLTDLTACTPLFQVPGLPIQAWNHN